MYDVEKYDEETKQWTPVKSGIPWHEAKHHANLHESLGDKVRVTPYNRRPETRKQGN